jgi:hypothetical protein
VSVTELGGSQPVWSRDRKTLTINYDAFPDGTHLAVAVPVDDGAQLSVVVNWIEELRKKLKR